MVQGDGGVNPHFVLLNEIFTREESGKSQFVEIKRAYNEGIVSLKGYSLMVLETHPNRNMKPHLVVRSCFDLSSSIMVSGQSHGLVGRADAQFGPFDILGFHPGQFLKLIAREPSTPQKKAKVSFPTYDDDSNFLTVNPHRTLVVLLMYNQDTNIFMPNIWNLSIKNAKALKGNPYILSVKQTYIFHSFVFRNLIGLCISKPGGCHCN